VPPRPRQALAGAALLGLVAGGLTSPRSKPCSAPAVTSGTRPRAVGSTAINRRRA